MGNLKIKILCILTQVTLIITYITIDIWSIVFNSREYFHVPVEYFHSHSFLIFHGVTERFWDPSLV